MLFILYGCKSFHKYFDNTFRRVACIIAYTYVYFIVALKLC